MIGLYLALGSFVAGLAMGGYAIHDWDSSRQAAHERDLAEAQEKVDELAQEVSTTAAKGIENERIAYMAGEANAQTKTKVLSQKATYAANAPVMRNPVCTVPSDALQLLNAARSGADVNLAANSGGTDAAVRGTGAATGRADGDPVPANDSGRGAVPAVQPQASSPVGGGQVSGASQGRIHQNPLQY